MTLTLELPPELETELQKAAAQRGQDPATFAAATLAKTLRDMRATTNSANKNGGHQLSTEEIDAALDELEAIGSDLPASDDTQLHSRADLYLDHD